MATIITYALPIAILLLTIALFFVCARRGYRQFGWLQIVVRVIVALPLLLSGVALHFLRAGTTVHIIPPGFPAPYLLVIVSGVLEIAGAVALFLPPLRRSAGLLIALMMVAIFPANIYVAGRTIDGLQMPVLPVRMAMQVVYILMILITSFGLPRIARSPGRQAEAR